MHERKKSSTVLFWGKVNNESGFENICDAARILSNKVTFVFILGERDVLPSDLQNVIKLMNVSSIEMRKIYEMVHVAVGQISVHSRLKYTIPHKAFEAGCFRKAYVTSGSDGIMEIYNDESVFYLSEASPESLSAAILSLTNDEIRNSLEIKIGLRYQRSLSQEEINKEFARLIRSYTNQFS